MSFTQVAVTGSFQHPDGTPAAGSVSFTPTAPMRNSGGSSEMSVSAPVEVALSGGALSVSLAATDDAGTTPTGVVYHVQTFITGQRTARFNGSRRTPSESYFIEVPAAGGAIDLASVPRAEPITPSMAAYLTQAAADALYEPVGGGTSGARRALAVALTVGG